MTFFHHKMLQGLCISDLEKNLCITALEATGPGSVVCRCLVSDEDAPWPVDRCLPTIFLTSVHLCAFLFL